MVAESLDAFTFDGQTIPIHPGDTVASALHRAGVRVVGRSLKYHRPRGYACGVGSCASCFVAIDGEPNVPSCTRAAESGAAVVSQNRLGSAKRDLLGVVDKVYPKGFDPHGAFTKPAILNKAFMIAVRFMSGVGKVPDVDTQTSPSSYHELAVDHLVIGAGSHGIRAALASAEAEEATLVVDELRRLGGGALWNPDEKDTRAQAHQLSESSADVWTETLAFGMYDGKVALARPNGTGHDLWLISATRITLSPGRHDGIPLFPNNDLPGVMSLRGAQRLLHGHDVAPGKLVAFHGTPPDAFVAALENLDGRIVAAGAVQEVRGGTTTERVRINDEWYTCDAVVCDLPGTPRIELAQQAGCKLSYASGVLAPVTQRGATTVPHIHAHYTEATP